MGVAREFIRDVHQNVAGRITGIGMENEIELHAVLVANNGDMVPLRSVRQGEPEHAVKGERAIEIRTRMPI